MDWNEKPLTRTESMVLAFIAAVHIVGIPALLLTYGGFSP